MKTIVFFFLLLLTKIGWSQNGYVERTIFADDTTFQHKSGQIYWKLFQGVKDAIIESTMPEGRARENVQYPIISREYVGAEARYLVRKSATEQFTIIFDTENDAVTYVYDDRTLFYKGDNVKFTLHD